MSSNDFELTLELGCDKYPAANVLQQEWNRNKNALINYIWQARLIITKNLIFLQSILIFLESYWN